MKNLLKIACTLPLLFLISCDNSTPTGCEHTDADSIALPYIPYYSVKKQNEILPASGDGEWDTKIREIGNVVVNNDDPLKYKMVYSGNTGTYVENNVYIGLAESADGVNWTKSRKVLERSLEDPYLVLHNGVYYLYVEDKEDVPFRNIRLYTSKDLITWVDKGDVLDHEPGTWEAKDVSSPVVLIENDTWYMLYEGRDNKNGILQYGTIGLALSKDGINWEKYESNPVLVPNNYEYYNYKKPNLLWAKSVVPDDIVKVQSTYYFSFHAHDIKLDTFKPGMMVSNDLKTWKDVTGQSVAEPGSVQGGVFMFLPFISPDVPNNQLPYELIYSDAKAFFTAVPN